MASPSPTRRRGSPYPRRVGFSSSNDTPSVTQSSTCIPPPHEFTYSDDDLDKHDDDYHQQLLGPHNPSSCNAVCASVSAIRSPRLMVVHAAALSRRTGEEQLLTIFLDSGSHLGLYPIVSKPITTLYFGGHEVTEESGKVILSLVDQFDDLIHLYVWTREVLTTVPPVADLEDPCSARANERVEVDVLVGIDHYWRIVDLHKNEKLPSGLIQSHTPFGPVLSERMVPERSNATSTVASQSGESDTEDDDTEELVRSIFGLDTIGLEDQTNVSMRRIAAQCIAQCVACKRHHGRSYYYPKAPNFPAERVVQSRPFQNIGLDYFGPITVCVWNNNTQKIWICCAATAHNQGGKG
ncbi:hypothetical protein OESDEN_01775 [Oesophagostomum dentatum]|uniref:Tas retrotransposon peptidase A16 n=1 Tax=Oesophagostomum dentatum TaxID=61180 RepID=A0A0B1TR01_OESDE|nr:hypothetical protein OESDEN_01775 [Oesophagostomum dentatum]